MQEMIKKPVIAMLILSGIGLFVFYPTLDSGVIDLDDTNTILAFNDPINPYQLKKDFWMDHLGRYYRPLVMLSYWIDSKIWMFEYSGYHLTNIVFHVFNTLLFYWVAFLFFKGRDKAKLVAFFLSFGFTIHPLTIESVAWIAGRSDIFACFFILLAFLSYLSSMQFRVGWTCFFFLLGMMVKESAVCLIPILLIHEWWKGRQKGCTQAGLVNVLKWISILIVPILVYSYFRFAGFSLFNSQESYQTITVHGVHVQKGESVQSQMLSNLYMLPAIITFYLKKLVWPFPLNFAIHQINIPLYTVLAGFILSLNIWLILKKKYLVPVWLFLLITTFAIALPVGLADVAWTRFAERYLYLTLPLFFLFVGCTYYAAIDCYPKQKNAYRNMIIGLLVIFTCGSVLRVQTWKSKESIWADTYKKNPYNGKVLYKYGSALDMEKGMPYFRKAVKHAENKDWKDYSLLVVAREMAKKGDVDATLQMIHQALDINPELQNCKQAIGILRMVMRHQFNSNYKVIKTLIRCYESSYQARANPVDLINLINLNYKIDEHDVTEMYKTQLLRIFPDSKQAMSLQNLDN